MVPYIEIPPLEFAGQKLYAFDILVAIAIVVGVIVADRRAKRLGLNPRVISDVALWAVVPGFLLSHWVAMFVYAKPAFSWDRWYDVFVFWNGMSSMGGFLGGAAGVIFYFRWRKVPLWPYANALVFGFTAAWIFGRLGCTVAHDHPGLPTDFFLAVNFPEARDGFPAGPRHDLGFYEFLWAVGLMTFFFLRRNKPEFAGYHTGVFLVAYTPIRFLNDFLRTADVRYLGLTPGQYVALVLFPVGIWLLISRAKAREILIPGTDVHIFADGTPAILPKPPPSPG